MKIIILIALFCSFMYPANKLKIAGATTLQPVVEDLVQLYFDTTGTTIIVEGSGSQKGIEALRKKTIDVAMVSRELRADEIEEFDHKTIAYDALALIVNKNNPIDTLTKQQLVDIYKNTTKNWQQLKGKNGAILLVSKQKDRGTMHIFEHYSGLFHPQNPKNSDTSKMVSAQAWEAGANNEVIVWVGGIPTAIGFVSFGSAKNATNSGVPLKIITIDGFYPDFDNIQNKSYPLTRSLNLVYHKSNHEAKKFVEWMFEDIPQMMLEQYYFVGVVK